MPASRALLNLCLPLAPLVAGCDRPAPPAAARRRPGSAHDPASIRGGD